MKKSILNLEGAQVLSRKEQVNIIGSGKIIDNICGTPPQYCTYDVWCNKTCKDQRILL
jgi:hypothetical protein